jgi:cytochrome c556
MFVSNLTKLAASALGLGILATAVLAGPADDAIKARQACMKANGAIMGVAVPIIKGEKPYDKAAIDGAITAMETACGGWATFWGADTQQGESAETWAKPEIWSDAAGFEAAGNASYGAMQALKASADEAAFKTAFPAVGNGCQGCHEKFRRPKG